MKNNKHGSAIATTNLQSGAYEYCPTPDFTGSTSIAAALKKSLKHNISSYVMRASPPISSSREVLTIKGDSDGKTQRNGWNVEMQWSRMRNSIGKLKKIGLQDTDSTKKYHQRNASGMCQSEGLPFSSEEYPREVIDSLSQDNISWSGSICANYFNRHANGQHLNREEQNRRMTTDNCHSIVSLHDKYQPKNLEEIVGHEIVVKLLSNAIQQKKVSCLYLFHGPRGSGKTTTARLFAMALLCESNLLQKPCWHCGGCYRSLYIMELCTGSRTTGFQRISTLVQNTSFTQALPGFKVFIIEESNSLTAEAWEELLSILENSYNTSLVFVLIAVNANTIPTTILSRCEKFYFQKLKNMDVRLKLTQITSQEDIRIDDEALNLIISKADGSLREAEHLLVQLTLLDSRITTSMVQQLVGLVPQSKIIGLLIAALSGDTQKTVIATRELIATGVEPQAITSQLVSMIADILSGATVIDIPCSSTSAKLLKDTITKTEPQLTSNQIERLCYALKALVKAEKQPRSSADSISLIYAALLSIASNDDSSEQIPTISTSKADQNLQQTISWDKNSILRRNGKQKDVDGGTESNTTNGNKLAKESMENKGKTVAKDLNLVGNQDMSQLWSNILENLQNRDIKEFLSSKSKLASLTVSKASTIVHMIFQRSEDKLAAHKAEETISNALSNAVGHAVTVNMSLEPTDLIDAQECFASVNSQVIESNHSRQQQQWPDLLDSMHNEARQVSIKCNEPPESSVSEHNVLRERQLGMSRSSRNESMERDHRPVATAHMMKREQRPKHMLLSLSSIPQSDASVEPYSQDIKFELLNLNKGSKEIKNSNIRNASSAKVQQEQDLNVTKRSRALTRAWSCKDRFC